jgi:hypothetical protein
VLSRVGGGVVGEKAQGGGRLLLKIAGVCQAKEGLACIRRWHKREHHQYDDAKVNAPGRRKTVA